ncbi:MAG: hypothetical protein KGN97_08320 [Bacteroidota bacterium]|jgi:hypothetical protein|nr:hypothetical protein [Bacteroidota bacterium]
MKMKYGFIIASGVLLSWMFTACKSTATDTVASQDTIEKVPPHLMIATVPPSPKFPDAKIAIATVQASLDADDSVKVDFNFSVKDYQLSIQTDDAADKGCNNATKGQHIHFIMDNKPYTALYEPKHSVRVAKNSEHYVLVFLSRSYHESIKEKKAAQLYHFKIDKKGNLSQLEPSKKPMLFYSRPKGEYVGADMENVLLDYYVVNAAIHPDSMKVKVSIVNQGKKVKRDTSFTITSWEPLFVKNLRPGKATITISLLDHKDKKLSGLHTSVSREITLKKTSDLK